MACEPIRPSPTVMRSHRTWWARGRGKARRHAGKRKDLDVLPAKVGSSRCGEVLAQAHPPSGSVRAGPVCAQQAQVRGEARDDGPHSRDGLDPLWPPFARHCSEPRTRLTIRLIGQVDAGFRKGILLTHFAQPQAGPGWAAQLPVLLQHARPLPRNAPWLVRTRRPTATGHTLAVRVLKLPRQQELLWEGPTRVSRTWTPCIACPRQRRRFHAH